MEDMLVFRLARFCCRRSILIFESFIVSLNMPYINVCCMHHVHILSESFHLFIMLHPRFSLIMLKGAWNKAKERLPRDTVGIPEVIRLWVSLSCLFMTSYLYLYYLWGNQAVRIIVFASFHDLVFIFVFFFEVVRLCVSLSTNFCYLVFVFVFYLRWSCCFFVTKKIHTEKKIGQWENIIWMYHALGCSMRQSPQK